MFKKTFGREDGKCRVFVIMYIARNNRLYTRAEGLSPEEITKHFPPLTEQDVRAANESRITATLIRVPWMHGSPPHTSRFTTTRFKSFLYAASVISQPFYSIRRRRSSTSVEGTSSIFTTSRRGRIAGSLSRLPEPLTSDREAFRLQRALRF